MSNRRPECQTCPVADGQVCPATRHAPYCDLFRRRPDVVDEVLRREGGEAPTATAPTPHQPSSGFPTRRPPDGRIRVGLVSPTCYIGGAELWIGHLLDHCDGSKLRWEGIAVRDDSVPIIASVRGDWEAHCPVVVGPEAIRELAGRVDILIVWGLFQRWGFTAESFAPLVGDVPLIYVSHGAMGDHMAEPGDLLPRTVAAAVSRAALRGVPEAFRADARVIPNMVDPARVRPTRPVSETRAILGIPEGAKVAGWLGRLSREKRPEVFIRAIAKLPEPWVGVMAGIGWQESDALALAAEVAPGRVIFAGGRDDVGDLLAVYECLCMPSASEACSLAAAEAWAAEVPLVSTQVGVLEDHPWLARLIPNPPTGEDLASAILTAHEPERIARARDFALTELSPKRFGREWTDLILSAAPPPPKPPGLLAMAANLGKAVVAHVADGGRIASPEVQAARKMECFSNSCGKHDAAIDRCFKCGCVAMNLKRSWASSACPEGRWLAV